VDIVAFREQLGAGRGDPARAGPMYRRSYYGYIFRVSPIVLLLLVGACHIKLVSDYDDNFVKAAAVAENEISTFIQSMKNPAPGTNLTYAGNIATYNKIEVDLNSCLVLASSHENNVQTIAQINTVIDRVHAMAARHRAGPLSPAYLDQKQKDISLLISIVIRTENDKKAAK
jgi:hypothetical protein